MQPFPTNRRNALLMRYARFSWSLLPGLVGACCCLPSRARAQALELETDPTYYFNHGYSVDVGYATERLIFRALPFQTDVPKLFHGQDDFAQTIRGGSVDIDYFFKKSTAGFFAGPVLSYTRDELTNRRTGEVRQTDHYYTGVRLGYRWFPFWRDHSQPEVGFFVTPFVSPILNFAHNQSFGDGRTFEYAAVSPFGGVHLGYKFRLRRPAGQ